MKNKILASMREEASEFMKDLKKKIREWWGSWWVWWDEFKFKHPWRACSLQYFSLFLFVFLVGHILSAILSDMANVDYFRYPLNETFRHPFNATANLTINKSAEMHTTETYAAEMYADNARSILCTLVGSEAAIVAIVVSLTLIAIELTASAYSPRVMDISIRNPDMWILLLIYGVSIFYAIVLIKQLPYDSGILYDDVSLAFWLGVVSYAALVPYLLNTIRLLKPTNIVKRVSEDIAEDKILKALSNFPVKSLYHQVLPQSARRTQRHQKIQAWIETVLNSAPSAISAVINRWVFRPCQILKEILNYKKDKKGKNGTPKGDEAVEDQIQPILDIIYRSINNYDLETVRNGLKEIVKHAEKVIALYLELRDGKKTPSDLKVKTDKNEMRIIDNNFKDEEQRISKYFCDPLKRISRLAASKDDAGSTIDVIKTLETFGVYTAKAKLNAATEQVAAYLGAVGKISAGKGKAFEDAVSEVAKSLEEVGKAAVGEGKEFEDATEQVAIALGAVGKAAVDEGLEEAIEKVVLSLIAVGKAAVDDELEDAVKRAASALEKVGIAAAADKEKKLDNAVKCAALALEKVGIAAAADKEKKLDNAVNDVASSLGAVGVAAAVNELEAATQRVSLSLGVVGKAAAEIELVGATIEAITSLNDIGKAAAEYKLRTATEAVLLSLFEIEQKAVLKEPEYPIKEATLSLGVVGKAAAEYKLKNETQYAASVLSRIGKADLPKKFEDVTKWAVESLLDIGTTAVEKEDFQKATQHVATSLAELAIFNIDYAKLAIDDYKALDKTSSKSLEKFLERCKEGL